MWGDHREVQLQVRTECDLDDPIDSGLGGRPDRSRSIILGVIDDHMGSRSRGDLRLGR
jgi:hypothetical protein